jgi:hypothetical protein
MNVHTHNTHIHTPGLRRFGGFFFFFFIIFVFRVTLVLTAFFFFFLEAVSFVDRSEGDVTPPETGRERGDVRE